MSAAQVGPHGGDGERIAAELGVPLDRLLDLSASLNPLAPDVRPVLVDAVDDLGRYPDDTRATHALAECMDVDRDRLVLTNGGAEAIALVAADRPAGWVEEPEFSLYARHLREVRSDAPRWMSDPNNPTGRLAPLDVKAAVRDEAFYLLATGRWTRGDEGTALGSLTKAWALPGLRIGYVLAADAEEAERIRHLRPRWSVNGLVCAALPALLELAAPDAWANGIAELRDQLATLLGAHGIRSSPSDANFLWIPSAPGLRRALLDHGILVRSGHSFGSPDAVRIAVPDPRGLERLARALPDAVDAAASEASATTDPPPPDGAT